MEEARGERIDELERRVDQLESELALLRGGAAPKGCEMAAPDWSAPPAAMWPSPRLAQPPVQPDPVDTVREPIHIDSEVVLKWGGVGLVVLAVGFAVSTAISRGWIGPELQLAGALLVSIGLVVTGLRLQGSRPAWTHALCAAGIAAAITTVASKLFLDQASDSVAFASTVVIGLTGFFLARHVPSEWVAATTLLGGGIGWLVIADGNTRVTTTVIWFAVLVAVAVGLALQHGWFAVRVVAHVAGQLALLGLAAESDGALEHAVVLGAAVLLAASMFRVPSIGDLATVWQQLEVQAAMSLAPWAFGVIALTFELEGDNALGSVAVAAAVAAAAIAIGVRRWNQPAHFVSLVVGASIALSIGLALLLSTTAAIVALAVQAAGLVVLSRALQNSVRVLVNAAVVAAVVVQFLLVGLGNAWHDDAPWADDLGHGAIVVALGVAGWQTRQRSIRQLTGLAVLGLSLFWLGSVLVHLPQGQAVVSVSWAIVGTAVLVAGAVRKMPELGIVGLAVLGLTVAKLLTVDLREVDTLWRAGLFFVIGLGFLRLGFLLPRLTGGSTPGSAGVEDEVERG